MAEIIVRKSDDQPNVMDILTGIKKIKIKYSNENSINKWIDQIKLSQENAKKSSIKLDALRDVLSAC